MVSGLREVGLRAAVVLSSAVLVAGVIGAPPAHAAAGTTYHVSKHEVCGGAGTLQDALSRANSHPGRDTIEVDAGLVWMDLAPCWQPWMPIPFGLHATDSVDLMGNGVRVEGNQMVLDSSGHANNPQKCPSNPAHGVATWVAFSTGFMQVGTYKADNSAVSVTVAGMDFHNMNSMFKVERNASLTVTDSHASAIDAFLESCDRAAIETAYEGANVTLRRVTLDHSHAPGANTDEHGIDALVVGGHGGNLVLDQVYFAVNTHGRAVTWMGSSATIVSSRFVESGALQLATPNARIVNSAFYLTGTRPSDRVVTEPGHLDVTASTFYWAWGQPTCATCTLPGMGFVALDGSTVRFQTTAIGASDTFGAGAPLLVGTPGAYTSDSLTWVQPTRDAVSPGAVRDLLPNAMIAPPGLTTSALPWLPYESTITPLLGTPAQPGVLIDAVPDAQSGGANQLLNPIDGSVITKDVFGNPRTDANDTRDIGAVQLTLAPRLAVTATTVHSATLGWSRPTDPTSGAITGYALFYRVRGSGSAYTRVDVPGAGTLTREVIGLRADTPYDFYVVGVNPTGDGPRSNVVVARTLPEPPIPSPEPILTHLDYPTGVGVVGSALSPLDPHVTPAGTYRYRVTSGSLPAGLAIDPTTGVISGVPTRAGARTVTVQASGATGTVSASVTITIHATAQPAHLDYPLGRGTVGTTIDPLSPHTAFLTGPLAYTLTAGSLPPGLGLDPLTGVISGTPSAPGVFQATITVVGAGGASATSQVRIEVASPSALLTVSLAAVSHRSKLKLTVHNNCPTQFTFRLQKLSTSGTAGGSDEPTTTVTWSTLPGTYRTKGSSHSLIVNKPRGTYRALVGGACLFSDTQSPQATLRR